MIFKNQQFDNFIKKPSADIKAILFYGPNDGLVSERFNDASKLFVDDVNDPFRVVNISSEDLDNDKSLLITEVSSLPFMGGRKVIRIKNAGNNLASYFKDLFKQNDYEAFVIVAAGELKPKSSLRKLFEEHTNAAAVPCYIDDISDVANIIQSNVAKNGYSISSDALSFISSHLGADRKIIFSEIEKLCLYMGDKKEITITEAKECIGDSASLTMEDLCYAITEGKHEAAQRTLDNLLSEGVNPVTIIRVLSGHFQKIYLTCDKISQGMNADSAVKSLKPPIMFKKVSAFRRIVEHWNTTTSSKAISLLFNAEIAVKTTAYPQDIICAKFIAQITGAGHEIMKRRI